jgi:hypothetical protein
VSRGLIERLVLAALDALQDDDPLITIALGEHSIMVAWDEPDTTEAERAVDP